MYVNDTSKQFNFVFTIYCLSSDYARIHPYILYKNPYASVFHLTVQDEIGNLKDVVIIGLTREHVTL